MKKKKKKQCRPVIYVSSFYFEFWSSTLDFKSTLSAPWSAGANISASINSTITPFIIIGIATHNMDVALVADNRSIVMSFLEAVSIKSKSKKRKLVSESGSGSDEELRRVLEESKAEYETDTRATKGLSIEPAPDTLSTKQPSLLLERRCASVVQGKAILSLEGNDQLPNMNVGDDSTSGLRTRLRSSRNNARGAYSASRKSESNTNKKPRANLSRSSAGK